MKKLLLNRKNLIIILICLVIFMIPNVSFADSVSINEIMKNTISMWFVIIRRICAGFMAVVITLAAIKALLTTMAGDKANLKNMLVWCGLGLILLYLLPYILSFIIYINEVLISKCKTLGENIADLNGTSSAEYESDDSSVYGEAEITLYDSAISKAYEIKFTSGTVGMIMYIILLYYTIKFFFVYLKRYVNVMVLFLLGSIVITISSFKRAIQGTAGMIGRWFKELIYNVFIQNFHALAYAVLVGLTVKFSSESLDFLGAILTLVVFAFIYQFDGIIRKFFNFVGGTSTVKAVDYSSIIAHPKQSIEGGTQYASAQLSNLSNKAQDKIDQIKNTDIKSKLKYDAISAKETLSGKNVQVSEEAIQKEQELMDARKDRQNIFQKISSKIKNGPSISERIDYLYRKERLKWSKSMSQNSLFINEETVKRMKGILGLNDKRKNAVKKYFKGETDDENKYKALVINFNKTTKEQMEELRKLLEENGGNVTGAIFAQQGIGVFIYPEYGSTHLGLHALKNARDVEKDERVEKAKSSGQKKTIKKPKTSSSQTSGSKTSTSQTSGSKAKKKWKIKEFGSSSIKKIGNYLEQTLLMSNKYLLNLTFLGQFINNEDDENQLQATTIGKNTVTNKTTLSRTHQINGKNSINKQFNAKVRLKRKKQGGMLSTTKGTTKGNAKGTKTDATTGTEKGTVTDTTDTTTNTTKSIAKGSGKQGTIYRTVHELKDKANGCVDNFFVKQAENQVALFGGVMSETIQNSGRMTKQQVKDASPAEIKLAECVDMGYASKISAKNYVLFGIDSDIIGEGNNEENTNAFGQQTIAPRKEAEEIAFTFETIENMSEEEKDFRKIADSFAEELVKYDTSIEELDVTDPEIFKDMAKSLAKKGLVDYKKVMYDEEEKDKFLEELENKKEELSQDFEREALIKIIQHKKSVDFMLENSQADLKKIRQLQANGENAIPDDLAENVQEQQSLQLLDDLVGIMEMDDKGLATDELNLLIDDAINKANKVGSIEKVDLEDEDIGIKENDKSNKTKQKDKKDHNRGKKEKEQEQASSVEELTIYISGAVLNPGTYKVKVGSRIDDAIKVAGDLTSEADYSQVNGREFLVDRETIFIPMLSEDEIDKIEEQCRPVIEQVIKEYMNKNKLNNFKEISNFDEIINKSERRLATKRIENVNQNRIKEIIKDITGIELIRERKVIVVNADNYNDKVKEDASTEKARDVLSEGAKQNEEIAEEEAEEKMAEEGSNNDLDELIKDLTDRQAILIGEVANDNTPAAKHLPYSGEEENNM